MATVLNSLRACLRPPPSRAAGADGAEAEVQVSGKTRDSLTAAQCPV
jgi:hypothetical protein